MSLKISNPSYKLNESEIISSASIDKIFASTEFKLQNVQTAKYIWKVEQEDESGFIVGNGKRLKIQLIYNQTLDQINGITLKKFNGDKEDGCVSVNNINLIQIQEFLNHIAKINLKAFTTNRVFLNGNGVNNQEIIRQVNTLLDSDRKIDLIKSLLAEENITNEDIVNTGFRKRSLTEFAEKLKGGINEKDWQTFFEKNEWIFGYGLDYRFQAILQREYAASETQADGSNQVTGDFLLGDTKFATFVELKKSNTKLFGSNLNRSNTWKLSTDLFDSYSQILEQKSSGQIKYEKGNLFDNNGNKITQKPYDSKTILIIGNWSEIFNCRDQEKEIKQKTFELFRRDSRNIEIITYDELFERAYYIVYQEKMPEDYLTVKPNPISKPRLN